jgi:hypothetical protein
MTLTGYSLLLRGREGGRTLNSVNLVREIFRNDNDDSEKMESNHQEFSDYHCLAFGSFSGFNLKY